ncbi:hypothetical protein, partial [uncultured Fibrobacter sp.]|uniref:hypothetical protein n=1 Tax=uncultured Fibrobacter sp. TaxID=261512 RepID=UPI0028062559
IREERPTTSTLWAKPVKDEVGLDALCRARRGSEERALARDSERITPFSRSKQKDAAKRLFLC